MTSFQTCGVQSPGSVLAGQSILQASRRLDWRFLLPAPDLGQVAYIGPARGTLLEALRLFSASLAVIEMSEREDGGPSSARYEVVVVSTPAPAALRQAVMLLRPGGWLYVEAHSPFSRWGVRRRFRWPRFARDYRRLLHQLGMDEIQAHWHWPDFESCTKIIPLDNRTAILHAFAAQRPGVGALLRLVLGRRLLHSGLLALVVQHFGVVARRRPDALLTLQP